MLGKVLRSSMVSIDDRLIGTSELAADVGEVIGYAVE